MAGCANAAILELSPEFRSPLVRWHKAAAEDTFSVLPRRKRLFAVGSRNVCRRERPAVCDQLRVDAVGPEETLGCGRISIWAIARGKQNANE